MPRQDFLQTQFERFLKRREFPCVGAKSALGKGQIDYFFGRDIRSAWNDLPLRQALAQFGARYRQKPTLFRSFVAIFARPLALEEEEFEAALWKRCQSLHEKDIWLGAKWDRAVDPDPNSPHFGLSIGGSAFFVVGLHSASSRRARRFRYPTLVFNLHDQFEQLREQGRYIKLRTTILERDEAWSGSVNPMLSTFGEESEARQYSGRQVGDEWTCPFKPRLLPSNAPS
ncbi:hypothetical protein B5C34_14960 [Pacificimonas flava]|uniref:YqcI/YcgG family protein n=2 Tax=Pacificimonas TaxID=1960290 RepID=A0A219B0F1_9SPHN|nr:MULTISPECIES: guanitoxin biosynthesis heme-dependent pre-guanitoxin N-hydroxylase GntA [Pacificimonas]MBZ6379737.1 YqcI/YcgG family protein [Pacificimonas aurantium]OWV31807.1 hypothetical protein B5C34_14960 [Pacificimonas flava]